MTVQGEVPGDTSGSTLGLSAVGDNAATPIVQASALEVPAASEPSGAPVRRSGPAVGATSRWHAALRFGVMPVLLAADVLVFAAAVALPGAASSLAVVLGVLIVSLYATGGLYRSRAHLSVLDDLPSLLGRALLAGACVTLVDLLTDGYEGRETVAITALFAVLVVCGRLISYTLVRHARRLGIGRTRTLIVGGDDTAHQLAEILLDRPEYGLHPVGFLDAESSDARDRTPLPHLGSTDELARVVRESEARAVVIAFGSTPDPLLVDALRRCDALSCQIFFVPRLYEFNVMSCDTELVWGLPLMRLRRPFLRGSLMGEMAKALRVGRARSRGSR